MIDLLDIHVLRNRGSRRASQRGISLLEVIIATAILAGSAMMLTSMFATGDRHIMRAEERIMAQMLCQSKLDELVADPAQLEAMQAGVFPHFPGWVWSLDVESTSLEGLVRIKVAVTRVPGMPAGADLSVAQTETASSGPSFDFAQIPDVPTFQLVRWLKFAGSLTEPEATDRTTPLRERLQETMK